jgi:quercetin dioxygenase-like cupin family protein
MDNADTSIRAFAVPAEVGERTEVPGGYHLLKATPEQTRNAFVLRDGHHEAGLVVAAHVHRNDEACYVLDGQYVFECEDQTIVGDPGTFVFLPRGLPHRFHVGPNGGRMLILGAPVNWTAGESSLEWRPDYFEELAQLLRKGPLTDAARLALRRKHGPSIGSLQSHT